MIIDLILDRKDGEAYEPKRFYGDCMQYGETGHGITNAMDFGTEAEVKHELTKYVVNQCYSFDVAVYVNSVDWLI